MSFFHGVRAIKGSGSQTVYGTASGIVAAVGTAPVNQVASYKSVVLARNMTEAKAALGYSDNWTKYTLCEVMYRHFQVEAMSPLLLINVADPATQKTAVAAASKTVVDGQVTLPEDTVLGSIEVKTVPGEGETAQTLVKGQDYDVFWQDGACIVEAISGGSMDGLATVSVGYDTFSFDPASAAMKTAVIGGTDTATGENKGLELLNDCYAMYSINPDIIIAPSFSSDSTVAAAMAARAESLNTVFRARAVVDADSATTRLYTAVPAWKAANGITSDRQILCWPMGKKDGNTYHMSTVVASAMAATDAGNEDCPSESPDNKPALLDSLCLADGTEIVLNLEKANYLGGNGIVTALNMGGEFRVWGSHTAAYPNATAAEEIFIPVARMMDWVMNGLILTYWSRIGGKLNRRICESIADSASIWINGLTSAGHLYGGRAEFNAEENPDADIMNGILKIHVYLAPVHPLVEIDFICEYDASYVSAALTE